MITTETHPYAAASPVFSIGDQDEAALARDLLRLDVRESTMGLRTLTAHFHPVDPGSDGSIEHLSYLDGQVFQLGTEITCALGLPDEERQVFTGTVSAVEVSFEEGSAPVVSISAEDALMALRLSERTATWPNMTDAAIVAEIASAHGMGAAADAPGPEYPIVQQWEQSDLAFIRDRALRIDAEIWIDSDNTLHFKERSQREGVELTLVQGNDLIAVRARVDLAHQRTSIEYRGWDDLAVEALTATATSDVVAAEATGGRLGPDVVSQVFNHTAIRRSRRDVLSADAAQTYAEAEMRRRSRGFVTVEGTTAGTPDLVPGARIELQRVGSPFEGSGYRAIEVHHSYDLITGYRTHFRAERPEMTQ